MTKAYHKNHMSHVSLFNFKKYLLSADKIEVFITNFGLYYGTEPASKFVLSIINTVIFYLAQCMRVGRWELGGILGCIMHLVVFTNLTGHIVMEECR